MENLQQATDEFIEVMSSPLSTNEEVNTNLQHCFKLLAGSKEKDIDLFMKRIFTLSRLPDLNRASLATTICGYLIEKGDSGDSILLDMIDLYDGLLDKSRIFYEMLYAEIRSIDELDEDRDQKIDKIYSDLLNDKDVVSQECYNAILSLDKFYACAVSLFSVNQKNHQLAKSRLKEKVDFVGSYNQGCYWIGKLFTVLFDEPIIVIDIDNRLGFAGKMSGVVDNYQLQHLLMGLSFLNDGAMSISQEDLDVVNGEGDQKTERSIENKWNLYNLELCEQKNWQQRIKDNESIELRHTWIWSESTPAMIPVYDGYRVILLGAPSYSRTSTVQRTFKNLKANIEVDRELTPQEIDNWLK